MLLTVNNIHRVAIHLLAHILKAYQNSWTLDARVGRWTLDAELWSLDAWRWTLVPGLWLLDSRLWTLDIGHWTLDSGLWTLSVTFVEQNQNPDYDVA